MRKTTIHPHVFGIDDLLESLDIKEESEELKNAIPDEEVIHIKRMTLNPD